KATVNATGDYTFTFTASQAPGEYQVEAASSDGKGKANGTLHVVAPGSSADMSTATFLEALDGGYDALNTVEQMITSVPDSPVKQQLETQLKQIQQKLSSRSQDGASFRSAVQAIQKVPQQFPDAMPVFEPVLSQLDNWSEESHEEIAKRQQELKQSAEQS